ncbi:DnaD domain-containing protein [Sinobaca sp. H24]|uniref:DnaD domain-containing protein n=1 Tax=Sinobaca sp. H24 TaxID=2923376 RepID=UPI00207AE513|nr:DnaD domain-containing protein [Sinobaca sp. H24]
MEQSDIIDIMHSGYLSVPKFLFDHYNQMDISDSEMMILLHLHRFMEEGEFFPTPDAIAAKMTITAEQCAKALRHLVAHGFITIEERENNERVRFETYSLRPLYERIVESITSERQQQKAHNDVTEEGEIYAMFEKELSRPLSPMESETISVWFDQDHYTPDMIKAALKEAVMSQTLSLRYIDRILLEWHRRGIKTEEQAKAHNDTYRRNQVQPPQQKEKTKPVSYPNINWLDE